MQVNFADLLPAPVAITVSEGKAFPVHGLPLSHVSVLLQENSDILMSFLDGDTVNFRQMALKSPELASKVIAMGADAVGQEEIISRLPLQVQLDALSTIWKLTVPDLGKLKELLSGVITALEEKAKESESPKLLKKP